MERVPLRSDSRENSSRLQGVPEGGGHCRGFRPISKLGVLFRVLGGVLRPIWALGPPRWSGVAPERNLGQCRRAWTLSVTPRQPCRLKKVTALSESGVLPPRDEDLPRVPPRNSGVGVNAGELTSARVRHDTSLTNKETTVQETPRLPVGREPSGNRHLNFVFS